MKRIQEGYGFSNDFTSQIPDYTIPQSYGVGLYNQPESRENGLQINTRIGSSPASAFYESELFMGLSESENRLFGDSSSHINQDMISNTRIVETPIPNSQCISFSENEQLLHLKNNLLGDLDHDSSTKIDSRPFDSYRDLDFSGNSYASHFAQFEAHPNTSGYNHGSLRPVPSSKTRIRWSQDLHNQFVECVNQLGGPEKATPKAILSLMDTEEELTILHVKSHLQKYRNTKYVSGSIQGSPEKRTSKKTVDFDIKTGMQLKEALQMQIDVQKRLHEQLEIQRNLQMRIEEQGKQLKMMLDQQQKSKQNLRNSNKICPNILSTSFEDVDEDLVSEGSDCDLD